MFILVGSRAARRIDNRFRHPNDWDLMCLESEFEQWLNINMQSVKQVIRSPYGHKAKVHYGSGDRTVQIEFEFINRRPSCEELVKLVHNSHLFEKLTDINEIGINNQSLVYSALMPVLYATKRSHIYWPIHWKKNIVDLSYMMIRLKLVEIHPDLKRYFDLRYAETEDRLGKNRVNLKMTNDAFFKKSSTKVRREFDHDTLHEHVKYNAMPMYMELKHDLDKAALARDLWDNTPYKKKLQTVREEACVIAMERFLIPKVMTDQQEAYAEALRKICTTLTKGWFRDFAIDNWYHVRKLDQDLHKLIKELRYGCKAEKGCG